MKTLPGPGLENGETLPAGSGSAGVASNSPREPRWRWGQCVYDADGDGFDTRGGMGAPGGSEGSARDDKCAFPEERKVLSDIFSQAGHQK